jgi:hypothetical protein
MIRVTQWASAYGFGDSEITTALAGCGLPGGIIQQDPYGKSIVVTKVSAKDVPESGIVQIAGTILSGEVTSADQNALFGGVLYSVDVAPLEILRGGQPLKGRAKRCLPGELVSLTVVGADTNSPRNWDKPPGETFKSWNPAAVNFQQLTQLDASDLALDTLAYYWCNPTMDANREVKCTVMVGGQATVVTGELKQVLVDSELTQLHVGAVQYYPSVLGLFVNPLPNPLLPESDLSGIVWQGRTINVVVTDEPCPYHAYLQLAQPKRAYAVQTVDPPIESFNIYHKQNNGGPYLDSGFPYLGETNYAGNYVLFKDSPRTPVAAGMFNPIVGMLQPIRARVEVESFQTHLEFTAGTYYPATWVPLKRFTWNWSGRWWLSHNVNNVLIMNDVTDIALNAPDNKIPWATPPKWEAPVIPDSWSKTP